MAPILVRRPGGKEILVVGQKSGVVWALDPDAGGTVLWSTRVGKGSALGGIHWSMATDGRLVYAANAAPAPGDTYTGKRGCFVANSAAPTVIPGVVAGGLVFVNSGYGLFGQMPGNVLLAFGAGRE